jgi:hypothetical protein
MSIETYNHFDIVARDGRFDLYQSNGPFWFSLPSRAAAVLAVDALHNPIEQRENESLAGVLHRAKRMTKVGDGISITRSGINQSCWLRVRKMADGTIWKRIPQGLEA